MWFGGAAERSAALSFWVGAGLLWGAGCAERRMDGPVRLEDGAEVRAPTAEELVESLMPRSMAVSGLTRLERDEGGAWVLVVHAELLDGFGQAVKWPGVLVVTLEPRAGGSLEPSDAAEAWAAKTWRVDLSTPERNAAAFDWVTRTYRVRLEGVPEWGGAFARGERRGVPYLVVRARLETWDGRGGARVVGGEGRIERGE